MEEKKPPITLDYARPSERRSVEDLLTEFVEHYEVVRKRRFWPPDPFAPLRIAGVAVGFVVSIAAIIWDHWAEHVIRVPLLWYQHEWWVAVAGVFCTALTLAMIKTRFFSSFAVGFAAGLILLVANYMFEGFFFGVDLLGRLTGLPIN